MRFIQVSFSYESSAARLNENPLCLLFRISLAGLFAAGLLFGGVLADSTTDFSGVQGGKNWYYGYFPAGNTGALTQLPTYNATTQQWQHTTFGPPWTLVAANSIMHPNGSNSGNEEWADREWVSNYSGQIIITGHLAKASYAAVAQSTGVFGRIYRNHQLLYEHFVAGTDSTGVNYTLDLTIQRGDVLDFAVAPNGADTSDTTLFSATISSEYDAVAVDFGTPVKVKTALGFLLGFEGGHFPTIGVDPPNNVILPLQPQFWRSEPYMTWYQRIRSVAPAIPIDLVLSDGYGYPNDNYSQHGPPWQNLAAYQGALQQLIAPFLPFSSTTFFEPWNEPDDGWNFSPSQSGYQEFWNGTTDQFYQTYRAAYQTIRSTLGPNAVVGGPSFTAYSHQGIQDFLEYCLANGCEVNSLTWHELNDSSSVAALPADVQDARTSFLQNPRYAPLKINRIDVTEIVGSVFTHQPAGTLAYYQALEASGADAGTHSCWPDSQGNNECFNGTLAGLLTAGTFQPRAEWWLHKSYADGAAARVQATSSDPDVVALASSSITGASTPQILIGNSNFQNTISNKPNPVNVRLSLANLQSVAGFGQTPNIDVRVELIPNTGEAAASQPTLVEEMSTSAQAGAAQVTLPPLRVGEVFRVTLVPPSPQVPTVASGGVVDPWNYTPGAAPGSWITIVGANLGPAAAQSWNPQPGAALPQTLAGVSVTIGGTPAALSYVSSSQINALVPASAALGENTLIVNNNGAAGSLSVLEVGSAQPAIYALPDPAASQNLYVTGALAGTDSLIGKPGVDPRVTRGAHPGETIDLYVLGLGATQDPALFLTNQLFSEAAPVAATVQVDLAGEIVSPLFAGLVSPGLYLVRFTVPSSASAGDLPILIGANGSFSPSSVYLTISQD